MRNRERQRENKRLERRSFVPTIVVLVIKKVSAVY